MQKRASRYTLGHDARRRSTRWGATYTRYEELSATVSEIDILALYLRDDKDIWELIDQHDLRRVLRAGQVIVNHGTGDPAENERIAASLSEQGVVFLDAPVSGGRPGAVDRTLTTLVGGDAGAYALCLPMFESFSRKVAHMGSVGMGQTTKLLNNALTMSNLKNAVDVFALGRSIGMDLRQLHEVITVSSGSSAVLQAVGAHIDVPAAEHLQELMRKDIEHFADAMRERGLDPAQLRERGRSGADGLVDLTRWVIEGR